MNVLGLCAGVGGLELGVKLAVPTARAVCYVERETYNAAVLVARMADGSLDEAPIWGDLATFDGRPWRGVVDCVTAGFPCQPFSGAGKRRGTADARWLWPHIERIIRDVGPRRVFLENVPGLIHAGLGNVLGSLAELGLNAEWGVFSAAGSGAPHLRRRVFILAYAGRYAVGLHAPIAWREGAVTHESHRGRAGTPARNPVADGCTTPTMADAEGAGRPHVQRRSIGVGTGLTGPQCSGEGAEAMADADASGRHGRAGELGARRRAESADGGQDATDANGEPLGRLAEPRAQRRDWPVEPDVGRVAHGVAFRVDRLRAIGNGVVPAVAARAWLELDRRLGVG